MSFLNRFGRLYQLLELRYKISTDHGFHALYEHNQDFKRHLLASKCIFNRTVKHAYQKIKDAVRGPSTMKIVVQAP